MWQIDWFSRSDFPEFGDQETSDINEKAVKANKTQMAW